MHTGQRFWITYNDENDYRLFLVEPFWSENHKKWKARGSAKDQYGTPYTKDALDSWKFAYIPQEGECAEYTMGEFSPRFSKLWMKN